MKTLLQGIHPDDPLVHHWLLGEGYHQFGPMFKQPDLTRTMLRKVIWAKILLFTLATVILIGSIGGIGAIIVSVNSFSAPEDDVFFEKVIFFAATMAYICICALLVILLLENIKSDGRIEHEIKEIAETQSCAMRLREALSVSPNASMKSLMTARKSYIMYPDCCQPNHWEMTFLLNRFGLGIPTSEQQGTNITEVQPPKDILGLYGGWDDDNHFDEDDDPTERWKSG